LFGREERHAFDAERVPDVGLHVLFERGLGQAFDDEAGPVAACAVGPFLAGLEDQRVCEAGKDIWAVVGFQATLRLVFDQVGVAGVVRCACCVGEEVSASGSVPSCVDFYTILLVIPERNRILPFFQNWLVFSIEAGQDLLLGQLRQ
jgi:hypothetical protein